MVVVLLIVTLSFAILQLTVKFGVAPLVSRCCVVVVFGGEEMLFTLREDLKASLTRLVNGSSNMILNPNAAAYVIIR